MYFVISFFFLLFSFILVLICIGDLVMFIKFRKLIESCFIKEENIIIMLEII